MKELSKELLIQTEDLLRLEKENMNEQLEVANNNKRAPDEIDRIIQCEKNLIELFRSNLNDHLEFKEKDKKDAI